LLVKTTPIAYRGKRSIHASDLADEKYGKHRGEEEEEKKFQARIMALDTSVIAERGSFNNDDL
jgi:hypothetical protein